MQAVLTFHGVDESGSVLSVRPRELASLVDALVARGVEIVPLERLLDDADRRTPRVALSFDDGLASVHSAALPVLRGLPVTLFLTSGRVGLDNRWPGQPDWVAAKPMLRWDEVEALAAAGFSIEAHSVTHPDLRALAGDALDAELAGCDEEIARRLGRAPKGFAYPYGHFDERVVATARRRYRFAVTTELAALPSRGLDLARVPRLDSFYLRDPAVQRRFGSASFRAWLAMRRTLRGVRARVEALSRGR